jgi:copper chaperone
MERDRPAGTAYRIDGMSCDGCARAVTRALEAALPGAAVRVDLAAGRATVAGEAAEAEIRRAVERAGFVFAGRA